MIFRRRIAANAVRCAAGSALGVAGAVVAFSSPVLAQAPAVPGIYLEAEGQWVLGQSDFEVGAVPDLSEETFKKKEIDEGDGWGGAVTLGYVLRGGWSVAVRYRRLEADNHGGPIEPGIISFAAADGGIPVPLEEALTDVRSETNKVDLEISRDIAVAGGRVQLFGGLSFASVDRDTTLFDCGCSGVAFRLGNTFAGAGPRIGVLGGVPLGTGISLVGGASAAALFGRSEFKSTFVIPELAEFPFKDKNDRVAASLEGEVGLAFSVGPGTLTVGYRVDALLGALDTDQRVSAEWHDLGIPAIGDRHDDLVEHGPFARLALPLGE